MGIVCKRQAEPWEEWWEWLRRLDDAKPRRLAWLRCKEVAWWDAKAQQAQDKADQGDALAQVERDAWAEHFRLIGESPGLVADQVWENVPCYAPMDVVWENAPAPNELHAALRKMSLGTAAGDDEVMAELLKLGGENLWEAVVKVCREQWLILTEEAPGAEAIWPDEWCVSKIRRTRTLGMRLLFSQYNLFHVPESRRRKLSTTSPWPDEELQERSLETPVET